MNLLDKASIILTPTAYNNGEALCVKPSDGSGDFDFSRNSAATRVNAQGLVEDVRILSSNLVQNGDFSDGSANWTLGTGWSIGGGSANCDGTQTSGTNLIQSNLPLGTNKIFKIEFELKDYQAGELIYVNLTGTGVLEFENINANGTYVAYSGLSTGTNFITFRADADFIGSIDNVSVKEVIDNTNLPRINYEGFSYDGSGNIVPDSGCGSWLWENQSTNLIPYSEDFNNAAWSKIGASVVSGFDSPDGGVNAFKLIESTNTGVHFLFDSASVLSGSTNYNSIYVKPNGVSWVLFYDGANNESVYFDLQNKVIGTKSAGVLDYSITELSDGWLRIGFSSVATSTSVLFRLYLASANGVISYTGDGTSGVYIWGAQVEEQSYVTSYIPTDGTSVTRNQDVCNNGGSVSTINSTEGVLYAEIAALNQTANASQYITISDGTYNNRASILFSNGSTNQIRTFLRVGGVSQIDVNDNVTDVTDFNKVAFSYKENNFKIYLNGVLVSTDTSGSVWSANTITKLSFSEINTTGGAFYGKTKCVAVWKEALSDEELTLLTTI